MEGIDRVSSVALELPKYAHSYWHCWSLSDGTLMSLVSVLLCAG